MNPTTFAILLGCVLVGMILIWGAVSALRTGTTFSNRGGPAGPITRAGRPGYFWFLFWVRIVLGPIALLGGLAGLYRIL